MKEYDKPLMSVVLLRNDDVVVTECIAGNSGGYDPSTGKPCGDNGGSTDFGGDGDPASDQLPGLN